MAVQHRSTRLHTGVAAIDRMHDGLFERMDRVYTDLINRAGPVMVLKQIEELTGELLKHFDEEEAEMRRAGYAGIEAHAADHSALRTQFTALRKRVGSGGNIGTDALDTLNQYFAAHITQFDLAWAKSLARS